MLLYSVRCYWITHFHTRIILINNKSLWAFIKYYNFSLILSSKSNQKHGRLGRFMHCKEGKLPYIKRNSKVKDDFPINLKRNLDMTWDQYVMTREEIRQMSGIQGRIPQNPSLAKYVLKQDHC